MQVIRTVDKELIVKYKITKIILPTASCGRRCLLSTMMKKLQGLSWTSNLQLTSNYSLSLVNPTLFSFKSHRTPRVIHSQSLFDHQSVTQSLPSTKPSLPPFNKTLVL
ncbi:hypothetical protein SCA6_002309 [Theobroma cacao]